MRGHSAECLMALGPNFEVRSDRNGWSFAVRRGCLREGDFGSSASLKTTCRRGVRGARSKPPRRTPAIGISLRRAASSAALTSFLRRAGQRRSANCGLPGSVWSCSPDHIDRLLGRASRFELGAEGVDCRVRWLETRRHEGAGELVVSELGLISC
jgi:hypothetical protein